MKYLYLIPITLLMLSCKSNILVVSLDNSHTGEAYLYNTITLKTDTISFSGNSFTINPIGIERPTLFYFVIKDINSFNRPMYIILSNQKSHVKFNKLIAINENSLNIHDVYPNRPFFLSDPNNNEEFYQFQDLWIKFYNNVTKPELGIDTRRELHTKFINESEHIIKKNNGKLVSAFIIDYLMNNNLIQLDKIQLFYSYLEPNVQQSVIALRIKVEVGFENLTSAPKFSFHDYHGNHYSLDSLTGKKILLHFWSSTCAPCIKEIPELLRLAGENKDLIIINISLDTDKSRWISTMKRLGIIDMVNYCDFNNFNGKIAMDYQIKSIPANYLIDEKGNILLKKQNVQGIIDNL